MLFVKFIFSKKQNAENDLLEKAMYFCRLREAITNVSARHVVFLDMGSYLEQGGEGMKKLDSM